MDFWQNIANCGMMWTHGCYAARCFQPRVVPASRGCPVCESLCSRLFLSVLARCSLGREPRAAQPIVQQN